MFLLLASPALAYTPGGLGTPEPIGGTGGVYAPGALGLAWTPAAARPDDIELALDIAKVPLGVRYELDSAEGYTNTSSTNSAAPSMGLAIPVRDIGLGLAVYPLAVRGGEPQPADGPQRFFTIEGGFQIIEADFDLAWRFHEDWTLGAVLRTGFGSTGGLKAIDTGAIVLSAVGEVTGVSVGDPLLEGSQRTELSGRGLGYGFALRYAPASGFAADLSVRSALLMKMSGTLSMVPSKDLDLALEADVYTELSMPPMAAAALTVPAGPLRVVGELIWIDWGSFYAYTSELSNQRIASEDAVMQDLLDSYGLSESAYLSAVGDSRTETGMRAILNEGLILIGDIGEVWEARVGAWNLRSAVPDSYVHPGNIDYDQIDLRGAVAWSPRPWLSLGLSGDKYFPFARTITDSGYSLSDPGQSGVLLPSADGTYELKLARYGLTALFRI